MKTAGQPFLWLVLGVAAATTALGATEGEIVTLGESGWREQTPALSAASGGTLLLSVLVPVVSNPADFSIELWQIAGGVMLPVGSRLPLADAVVEGSPNAQGVTVLRVSFPEVKRKTRMIVKFIATREPHVDAGRAQVWVYPQINWEPLARRFKNETPRLVLFGATGGLKDFLRTRKVVFSDHGPELPGKLDAGTLMVGVMSASEWRERKGRVTQDGGRLMVFLADAPGVPGVYTLAHDEGAITQVTLPVIEHLGRDLRAEDLFFQIVEQHLHATPIAVH